MPSLVSASLLRILAGLAGWLLFAWIVGLAVGHVVSAIAIALALYLAFYLRRLVGFFGWLRHRRGREPPDYEGIWGEIIAIVSRIDRRKQFHKRRVVELLR